MRDIAKNKIFKPLIEQMAERARAARATGRKEETIAWYFAEDSRHIRIYGRECMLEVAKAANKKAKVSFYPVA